MSAGGGEGFVGESPPGLRPKRGCRAGIARPAALPPCLRPSRERGHDDLDARPLVPGVRHRHEHERRASGAATTGLHGCWARNLESGTPPRLVNFGFEDELQPPHPRRGLHGPGPLDPPVPRPGVLGPQVDAGGEATDGVAALRLVIGAQDPDGPRCRPGPGRSTGSARWWSWWWSWEGLPRRPGAASAVADTASNPATTATIMIHALRLISNPPPVFPDSS